MKFEPTSLPGAWLITLERKEDTRGFFARTFCRDEFQAHGLPVDILQSNTSFNSRKGTLRGMHFQTDPDGEAKLVRCTAGRAYDVIVDLRPASPTHRKWFARELTRENGEMFFVPKGFAHGYQTLCDGTELSYQMFDRFVPQSASGVRWDDPAFAIDWPAEAARVIAEKDLHYPDYAA